MHSALTAVRKFMYLARATGEIAEEYHVPVLAQMPINPSLASACDNGTVEDLDCSYLEDAALVIERGQR